MKREGTGCVSPFGIMAWEFPAKSCPIFLKNFTGGMSPGTYDQFIGSIHDLAFGKMGEKREAISYLAKLGVGWIAGMALAAMVLSSLFESHIYAVSSAFMGFIVGAIPLVIMEEKESFANIQKGALFSWQARLWLS